MSMAARKAMEEGDLANAMVALTPGGIEAQEKDGQLTEASRQTLPIEQSPSREAFEKVGFEFGAELDEVFMEASFPDGWRKVPTDHSMWTDLVDGDGRVRGSIFYKAAFYDRKGHCRLSRRFSIGQHYEDDGRVIVRLEDGAGKVNWDEVVLPCPDWGGDRETALAAADAIDAASVEMEQRLRREFPEFEEVTAYWDEA